jgi:hypothetical protein
MKHVHLPRQADVSLMLRMSFRPRTGVGQSHLKNMSADSHLTNFAYRAAIAA